jgi:hypothetical protein
MVGLYALGSVWQADLVTTYVHEMYNDLNQGNVNGLGVVDREELFCPDRCHVVACGDACSDACSDACRVYP